MKLVLREVFAKQQINRTTTRNISSGITTLGRSREPSLEGHPHIPVVSIRQISGHHLEIHLRDGGAWVYDTSQNGVFFDGERLGHNGSEALPGDVFDLVQGGNPEKVCQFWLAEGGDTEFPTLNQENDVSDAIRSLRMELDATKAYLLTSMEKEAAASDARIGVLEASDLKQLKRLRNLKYALIGLGVSVVASSLLSSGGTALSEHGGPQTIRARAMLAETVEKAASLFEFTEAVAALIVAGLYVMGRKDESIEGLQDRAGAAAAMARHINSRSSEPTIGSDEPLPFRPQTTHQANPGRGTIEEKKHRDYEGRRF